MLQPGDRDYILVRVLLASLVGRDNPRESRLGERYRDVSATTNEIAKQNERETSDSSSGWNTVVPWRNLALAGDCMTAYISTIGASLPLLRSCKELPSPIAISLRDRGALNLFAYFD